MADLVGAFGVEGEKIRKIPVVELARRPLPDAGRREDPAERGDRILHAGSRGEHRFDLPRGDIEIRGEVRRGHAPVARDDLGDAGLQGRGKGGAAEGQFLEEDRARVIAHEEAVDLLGRVCRPPSDDADLPSGGRRGVPDRRDGSRKPRDRDLPPRLRVHLLKIEHAVDVRRDARRRRRPENRRDERRETLQPRREPLGRQPLPVRHLPLARQPVQQLEIQTIQPEP